MTAPTPRVPGEGFMLCGHANDNGYYCGKCHLAELAALREERDALESFADKVDEIRDSIIGTQSLNWSAHAYPLVAALKEIGREGAGYEEARTRACTQLEQRDEAQARLARLVEAVDEGIDNLVSRDVIDSLMGAGEPSMDLDALWLRDWLERLRAARGEEIAS